MTQKQDQESQRLNDIVAALRERFDAGLYEFRDQVSLVVKPEQVEAVCLALRDEYQFELLAAQTAVDYWPQVQPRFHVVYQIRSLKYNLMIGLRVPLDGDDPCVPTIENVYRNANWYERELWGMFGIQVQGHSDPRRILTPHDWQGHPLRKDYPLGYEEVQFTFNYDEIDERKSYAKE